ncbi:HAD-like protein [Neoconidiobolus thromboides FSU 785]|nr:HAD-like protein [Neoconidiobolus thromboides FSU 785]
MNRLLLNSIRHQKNLFLKTNITRSFHSFHQPLFIEKDSNKDNKDGEKDVHSNEEKPVETGFKPPSLNFDSTSRFLNTEENESKTSDGTPKSGKSNLADILQQNEELETGSIKTYREKSKLTEEKKERNIASNVIFTLCLLGISYYIGDNLFSEYTQEELEKYKNYTKEDSFSTRGYNRMLSIKDFFLKPKHTILLPPISQDPNEPDPMTICLELDETLIKITWDKERGFVALKRPGFDRFIGIMNSLFEVVIFTQMSSFNSETVLSKIDPYGLLLRYRLTKEHTSLIKGKIVKDLDLLGRDLNKVIVFDSYPDHCTLHPDNLLKVPAWDGNPNDTYLLDILPFLETLAMTNPKDVRVVLNKYMNKDIPKVLYEMELKQRMELKEKQKGGLRYWIGMESENLPLTPMMLRRVDFEKNFDKEFFKRLEAMKKEVEAEMKQHKEEMAKNKLTVWEGMNRTMFNNGEQQK